MAYREVVKQPLDGVAIGEFARCIPVQEAAAYIQQDGGADIVFRRGTDFTLALTLTPDGAATLAAFFRDVACKSRPRNRR